jgi:hypothetical protein
MNGGRSVCTGKHTLVVFIEILEIAAIHTKVWTGNFESALNELQHRRGKRSTSPDDFIHKLGSGEVEWRF